MQTVCIQCCDLRGDTEGSGRPEVPEQAGKKPGLAPRPAHEGRGAGPVLHPGDTLFAGG